MNGEYDKPQRIMQTVMGAYGNCQSACLAMMLGVPLDTVPNFAQVAQDTGDNEAYAAQGQWLRDRGWGILTVVKWQSLPWPPRHGYFIAGGPSPRGHRHAVIYKDGELWHDPHPDGGGISEVQDIDFLYPLNPCTALSASAPQCPEAAALSHVEQPLNSDDAEFGMSEHREAALPSGLHMSREALREKIASDPDIESSTAAPSSTGATRAALPSEVQYDYTQGDHEGDETYALRLVGRARKLERELAEKTRDADHFFQLSGKYLEQLSARSSTEKPADPSGDLMILRMALGNTAACLGDALATYNRFVGEEVFKNASPSATLDTQRMDEIERTRCYPYWSGDGWTFSVSPERSAKIERRGFGKTARDAIDAAMASSDGRDQT